jgi:peptide/nickel transport system permease protein
MQSDASPSRDAAAAKPGEGRPRFAALKRAVKKPSFVVGSLLCFVALFVALVGPFIAPNSPFDFLGAPFEPPSSALLLGADTLGRDVLSRVLSGGWMIVLLAALSAVAGVAVGATFGIAAAYLRGAVDEVIMRSTDVLLAFPQTILALLMLSVFGPQLWLVVVIVAFLHAPQVSRVARGASLRVIEEDYVSYAETIGMHARSVILREILPNIRATLFVEISLRFTYSVAIIAGLNFLGFGVQPPNADWGLMINENRIGLEINPWPVVIPVALIAMLTIGINMITDYFSLAVRRAGD